MNTPLWPLSWTFKQRRVAERKEFPLIGGTIDKSLEAQTLRFASKSSSMDQALEWFSSLFRKPEFMKSTLFCVP